ncbi:MAG: hypothetical protein AB1609_06735 [Bacillota bacterium]
MGQSVFVSFEWRDTRPVAFMTMDGIGTLDGDPEVVLDQAAELYWRFVLNTRRLVEGIRAARSSRQPVLARQMWDVGEAIFQLKKDLERLRLELDGVYAHLTRDLGVNRKWLERAVTFRRYLPDATLIPPALKWGPCASAARRAAERLRAKEPLDGAV